MGANVRGYADNNEENKQSSTQIIPEQESTAPDTVPKPMRHPRLPGAYLPVGIKEKSKFKWDDGVEIAKEFKQLLWDYNCEIINVLMNEKDIYKTAGEKKLSAKCLVATKRDK